MKKALFVLCALLAFALIFTGCGGNDAGGNPAGNGGTPTNGTGSGGNGGTPDGGNPAGGSDSLDGDWVYGIKMKDYVTEDDFSGNQELYEAFLASSYASETMVVMKFTISGNAYSAYQTAGGYEVSIMDAIQNNLQFPEPAWNTTSVDSGTVTVSGDTITFTSSIQGGGTGPLASDRKSFSITYGGGEPVKFVKQ